MSYHNQNLSDGKYPLWRHGRAWWGPFYWGWNLFWPTSLWLVSLRRWGFSVYLGPFGCYFGTKRDEDFDRGQWQVSVHGGEVWMEHPWVRQDGWDRRDPWWKKSLRLPVVDWLLGRWKHELTEGEPFQVYIPMPEGCYVATATPETRVWRRRFGIMKRRDSVWLEIPEGIPHSGKGENSWDCGDDGLCGIGGDTVEDAIANAVRSALRSRRRYGHDRKRTGAEPKFVVNEEKQPSHGC